MAPEAPADTAGPSSPPPKLPDGWLPQWEGVRRKWYYVQRTTGKSQWEIPTEPVILTPSTTPTPIGTGPSPAPSSNPINDGTRQVNTGDKMVGGKYSAADSARISRSLNSQMYGQADNSMHASGLPGWYSNQIGQHLPGGYEQQPAANATGYGPIPLQHGLAGNMNGQPAFLAGQVHQGYAIPGPHHLGQGMPSTAWGDNPGIFQGFSSAYTIGQNPQYSQGFPAGRVSTQNQQTPESWTASRGLQGQMGREIPGTSAHESPWQGSQQGQLGPPSEGLQLNTQPSTIPKPIFGSFPSPRDVEPSPREFAHHTSEPSLRREAQSYQSSEENSRDNSPHSMVDNARNGQGYPILRSHSQQAPTNPALHGFSPLQHVQSQYQRQHMIRTRSDLPTAQNQQQYYDPMAQGDIHHYVSQHNGHGSGPAGFSAPTHGHQIPYHQPRPYSEHSPGEPREASGTQFVSGPWP
ncbi:uncharacterized protein N7515_002688 [Penicillium bovifimosum]|uniref:WW domain-containing protein n=1 Tax=Penicillium bovifimosum TaxID=126998 RepID=A0A9W9HDW4_9EURO|nr:uncharacterized protein N7515_002688 [Penicillium bovifimosum]KAJ5143901.1 hypothetical protein N7515_002688 [Penicillium bovifimosum]